MVISIRSCSFGLLAGLMLPALAASADDPAGIVRLNAKSSAGVVRVSDATQPVSVRGQSAEEAGEVVPAGHLHVPPGPVGYTDYNCPPTATGPVHPAGLPWQVLSLVHNDFARKGAWVQGILGHDQHYGPCGHPCAGAPLAGCYCMVYPVDPSYFDRRDGQVYAAAGYGGPVSVPLAPVVNHTYNYGWGIPSSRLTAVQHPVTQAPMSMIPSPSPSAPVAY